MSNIAWLERIYCTYSSIQKEVHTGKESKLLTCDWQLAHRLLGKVSNKKEQVTKNQIPTALPQNKLSTKKIQ